MRRTDIVADTPLGDMCADRAQVPAARGSDYALPDQRSEVPHFAGGAARWAVNGAGITGWLQEDIRNRQQAARTDEVLAIRVSRQVAGDDHPSLHVLLGDWDTSCS